MTCLHMRKSLRDLVSALMPTHADSGAGGYGAWYIGRLGAVHTLYNRYNAQEGGREGLTSCYMRVSLLMLYNAIRLRRTR